MKKIFVLFVLILMSYITIGQILIGKNEDEIVEYMEEKYPQYEHSTGGFGSSSSSVKFVDANGDRTLMFFLDDNGLCKYSKLILDIEEYDKTIKLLNSKYKKLGDNKWITSKGGEEYLMSIDKTEWMFSIVTQLKD